MHHALEVEEILLNIFGHCYTHWKYDPGRTRTLAVLARTCRTFKEPALDVLWEELANLSPLTCGLPEASRQIYTGYRDATKSYEFIRPLQQVEWDTLRSYTRRVWRIRDFRAGLDWDSVKTFVNISNAEPLFPNLRSLQCECAKETIPWLSLPFPSLISIAFDTLGALQAPLESFSSFSPNVKRLYISCKVPPPSNEIISRCICRWSNLQTVYCSEITLNMDALVHLSHMPALTRLTFTVSTTLTDQIPFNTLLSFSNLRSLELYSKSLAPISGLLSRTRLPSIIDLTAFIGTGPSRQDFTSFLTSVQTSGMSRTIQRWCLAQAWSIAQLRGSEVLGLEDLRPCTAFSNLRRMKLDIPWNVDLTDSSLLALASAWPQLEEFHINVEWGWNMLGGITPNGLARLVQTCRLLTSVALAIDARGFIGLPPCRPLPSVEAMQHSFHIDVLDSIIEEESVEAIAVFIAGIVPHRNFYMAGWGGWAMSEHPEMVTYNERWSDVCAQAKLILEDI